MTEQEFSAWAVDEPERQEFFRREVFRVFEALRDAVVNARGDGNAVQLKAPATAENVLKALGIRHLGATMEPIASAGESTGERT